MKQKRLTKEAKRQQELLKQLGPNGWRESFNEYAKGKKNEKH